jgi:hypothetical protein
MSEKKEIIMSNRYKKFVRIILKQYLTIWKVSDDTEDILAESFIFDKLKASELIDDLFSLLKIPEESEIYNRDWFINDVDDCDNEDKFEELLDKVINHSENFYFQEPEEFSINELL